MGRIYGDKERSKKRMRRSTIDGEGQNGKKEKRGNRKHQEASERERTVTN